MEETKPHEIKFEICEGDFIHALNRPPRNQEEFDEWAYWLEKGMRNGHIDWDILYECANDAANLKKKGSEVV